MKAKINHSNNMYMPEAGIGLFVNPGISNDVKLVDFIRDNEKGQIIILLSSLLFSDDNVKIFIRENKMVIVVTEVVDTSHSATEFVTDWQRFAKHSYERIHNINLILPGDNFFLLRHYILPEKYLLKAILGQKM